MLASVTAAPLRELIGPDDEFLLSFWGDDVGYPEIAMSPYGELQNWHIIGRPGHPFLRAMIQRVTDTVLSGAAAEFAGKGGVVRLTGPVAYTLAVWPMLATEPHRLTGRDVSGGKLLYQWFDHEEGKGHYSRLSRPVIRSDRGG